MITLSVSDTLLSTLPLLLAIVIMQWRLGRAKDMTIAGARMVLQLVGVGYILAFLFEYDWPWLGLLIMCFMMTVSAIIAIRPLKQKSLASFYTALLAMTIGCSFHLAWIILVVLKLSPWYQPQFVIPLAGMVLANAMNALSLGAERFESELEHYQQKEAARRAFNAAMIPQINALLAVGLVSLPGMMTGQILSGVSPLEAIRYQIMVMSMVAGSSAVCLAGYFYFWGKFRT